MIRWMFSCVTDVGNCWLLGVFPGGTSRPGMEADAWTSILIVDAKNKLFDCGIYFFCVYMLWGTAGCCLATDV